jgi:hypothetical protein
MIQRETYERQIGEAQVTNVRSNAYRIHDMLEQKVRELAIVDFVTPTSYEVNVKDYLSIRAADAAQEVLRPILDAAQWSIRYEAVPTGKVQFGEIVNEITWFMSK